MIFASGEQSVTGVAVVGPNLVWTRPNASLVRSMPLAGGTASSLITTATGGPNNPLGIAADGAGLYLTDRAAGQVYRRALDGGAVWAIGSLDTPTGIAADGTRLFFTIQNQDSVDSDPRRAVRCAEATYGAGFAQQRKPRSARRSVRGCSVRVVQSVCPVVVTLAPRATHLPVLSQPSAHSSTLPTMWWSTLPAYVGPPAGSADTSSILQASLATETDPTVRASLLMGLRLVARHAPASSSRASLDERIAKGSANDLDAVAAEWA